MVGLLDAYRDLYRTFSSAEKPLLLWLIDGSENRESLILQLMAERKLPGYTALLNHLIQHSRGQGEQPSKSLKIYSLDVSTEISLNPLDAEWWISGQDGTCSVLREYSKPE